uniref:Secreted protein n=1 Tax=Aegilops tauschii subsp. strangulata TaxID=200361 RepID=A0A453HL40_AEGTS
CPSDLIFLLLLLLSTSISSPSLFPSLTTTSFIKPAWTARCFRRDFLPFFPPPSVPVVSPFLSSCFFSRAPFCMLALDDCSNFKQGRQFEVFPWRCPNLESIVPLHPTAQRQ